MNLTKIILVITGFSSGIITAAGILAFISELGLISHFADQTHTGRKIKIYEASTALGAALGNFFFFFPIQDQEYKVLLPMFGLLSGIFVGCWAMKLAEVLNIFPVFLKTLNLQKIYPYILLSIALGKGAGSVVYFINKM